MPTVARPARCVVLALLLGALACGGTGEYPNRPVTMVVPWAAGGITLA